MNAAKKQRLEDAGFRVGTPAEFLQLSTADCELIELRLLLDAAIRRAGGRLADKDAIRAGLRAADFASVRGNFKFGVNHYPVQDFWLLRVAKRTDGKFQTETVRKVLENDVDPWAAECRMR